MYARPAMHRLPNIAGRILGALLSVALALAPAGAVAAAEITAKAAHDHAAMSDPTPCDMPCDGCADGKAPLSCIAACSGMIAAIPAVDALRLPVASAQRMAKSPNDALIGRQREPDKPPPKLILA